MTALSEGGVIRIPRWVADRNRSADEFGEYTVGDLDGLTAEVRELAGEFAVPESTVLLAAHAAVLRVLTGEPRVSCGLAAGETIVPCGLPVPDGPWAELIRAAADAGSGVGPPGETVVDAAGVRDRLPDGTVLSVALDHGSARLRLTYRTDVADEAYAARLAGYHLAALRAMVDDPGAAREARSLLSAEELEYQEREFAGPHRELPDLRCHEVFEQRVRAHPDAIAASCAGNQLTYRELNDNANRVAHALLGNGSRPEDVVAVVTDRNLDWLACVLGVFKAGAAYLPIEPHFPAERVATMVRRSECRFVLVEPAHSAALASVAGPTVLAVDDCVGEGPTHDAGVPVAADQLAYIYFTSGSTGEPKGAMCEHAGLLNHLFAKIDDLGIRADTVVAQTAPQCFDISLWQLVSALMVGGRTLVIGQDSVLDVNRFVDEVVLGEVEVLQVVPSYLDVVLAGFEGRNGDLGRLRVVSTTGEALKADLVRRWFARFPTIKVVNAYGLTETSDDTNHEVLDGPPATDRISLGPPVANVLLTVADEWLRPVPLGAPGEIVVAGVCVGRGYINDEQRTKLSFLPDPAREGGRLYRTGDFGRWSQDGKLDYLGRRDAQVKIRGFRVEIDEVENRLLRVDGVRDAAVVVVGEGNASRLVAFYRTAGVPAEQVRTTLAGWLPEYMVPSLFHVLDVFPLTGNGKVDKKALVRVAGELADDPASRAAPGTETERRLAGEWAKVLGIAEDQIGRHDDFFDRGGTSLAAVRLMIGLDRVVSLRDLSAHPVLADLAAVIDSRTAGHPDSDHGEEA
ncbi:non-ribosomal peptide synthetase [Amycolatopsis sp. CA-230715]|uniref:non-ribosomal peptide synthetase n=1 Tax=Amycolatopsis sp. CA-230715 TaxID=2745196 RepID=UPI001C327724|nr:amino acid adenylation domain-containing protein [Amycolatopsis sp. CA-230715]QWF84123.1 Tyrocidine synthase 3 [Amycolatopsis sp. CA-230715]